MIVLKITKLINKIECLPKTYDNDTNLIRYEKITKLWNYVANYILKHKMYFNGVQSISFAHACEMASNNAIEWSNCEFIKSLNT